MRDQRAVTEQVAKNVRELRDRRGLSQFQLAERAGCSLDSVRRLEAGRATRFDTVVSIARGLELDVVDLIGSPARPTDDEVELMIQIGHVGMRLKGPRP